MALYARVDNSRPPAVVYENIVEILGMEFGTKRYDNFNKYYYIGPLGRVEASTFIRLVISIIFCTLALILISRLKKNDPKETDK